MDEDDTGAALPPPLSATDYPLWVVAMGVVVLIAFGYSLLLLPHRMTLARELADAGRRDAARDYAGAEKEYAALLADMPGSKAARLGMAHALFADSVRDNDVEGVALIGSMKLDRSDWDKLAPVMPENYRNQFVEEKP